MKLAIITAVHDRVPITVAFLNACKRIRDTFGVQTYIAITYNDDNLGMVQELGFPHIECENKPLGKKFNNAVNLLQDIDFTHLMILGSDDIISDRFMEYALTLDEYDLSGIDGLWFWGMNPRRAGFGRFGYFPVSKVYAGPGKMLSRKVVEACQWNLWSDNKNYAMDANQMINLRNAIRQTGMKIKGHRYSIRNTGGFMVDIKYKKHISSLSPILRRECYEEFDPYIILPDHLPLEECKYLFDLFEETEYTYSHLDDQ